jgi:hypothetical protein
LKLLNLFSPTHFTKNEQRNNQSTINQHEKMSNTTETSGKSTFGIELEIIVVAPDSDRYAPHHAVYEILQQPVYSTCPSNCEEGHHAFRLPIDDQAPSFWEHNQSDTETRDGFKKWIVTRDCSVRLTCDEQLLLPHDHSASDIEFASRILDFNNPSPCPHGQRFPCTDEPLMWDARTEISTIIDTVKRACNKPGWRVLVNSTCGMHVHIGHGQSGFNLSTAKNIMGMFTAFERCFDSILTIDRISGYEDDHAALPALQLTSDTRHSWSETPGVKYSEPLSVRQYEWLGQNLMNAFENTNFMDWNTLTRNGASIPFWLHKIYETTDFPQLGQLSTGHVSWVNLEHIIYPDTSNKPTVELRLHPGTFDTNEILAWVDLACNISFYAESNTTAHVRSYLESNYANPSFTIFDIARLVNASSTTIAHYASFLSPTYHDATRAALSTQHPDDVVGLYTSIMNTRISQQSPDRVSSKILSKLISGRYGQFPVDFLKKVLPEHVKKAVVNADARYLSDEMDEKTQDVWSEESETVVSAAVQRRNGPAGYALNNLFS